MRPGERPGILIVLDFSTWLTVVNSGICKFVKWYKLGVHL